MINETTTQEGDWPWHCAIFRSENGTQRYLCGCTLILSNIVITTAHCVHSDDDGRPIEVDSIIVHLGQHDIQLAGPHTQQIRAQRIVIHENFTISNYKDDIAMIGLTEKATYTDYVKPICLFFIHNPNLSTMNQRNGISVGWSNHRGQRNTLLNQVLMPYIPNKFCVKSDPALYEDLLTDRRKTLCAGFRRGTIFMVSRCRTFMCEK